ncbi:MAG: sensor histidine kinase [Acidobacteria bacterium]|nr:sensor histidine kinase [Acidobacteriota bacterium]
MASPSNRLILGAIATLLIIGAYAAYTLRSVQQLRQVQTETIDRNRKASLQLIRIQSDLSALTFALRDMLESSDGYPLIAWSAQLNRIHDNLDDALKAEFALSKTWRNPQQADYLNASFQQFWAATDQVFLWARNNEDARARAFIRATLLPRQEAITALTARLLVQNTEEDQRAATNIASIYSGIETNVYRFLALSVILVILGSAALIRSNRRLFDRVTDLSNERRSLARELISNQESTLRAISRDLHDEFGQILTAIGAMLGRARRQAPDTNFEGQVLEVNQIVQETLEKVRSLSQSLQPVILEEQGLLPAIEWHLTAYERQNGIVIHYQLTGEAPPLEAARSIHIYRILQEALNNIAKHAKVREASLKLTITLDQLDLEITDQGTGIPADYKAGVGLAGMRERAELLNGSIDFHRLATGTTVHLTVPIERPTHA